jgi:hypothetical protein
MRFNRFIFDNYLQTQDGKKALKFFNNFNAYVFRKRAKKILPFINRQYFHGITKGAVMELFLNINNSIKYQLKTYPYENRNVNSIELAEKYFEFYIGLIIKKFNDLTKRQILNMITDISLVLYCLHPDYFFPYFFVEHFFKIEAIFSEFNIPLPAVPSKAKYQERLYYYFELCKSLYDFRKSVALSPVELNIFLYFFAENIAEENDTREEKLPNPTKIYISGATKEDCTDIIEFAKQTTKTLWGGNINTLPGDIILIYGIAPFSQINSVWRAISKGFIDPFSYWYSLIWVGYPIKIPGISYRELVDNKIWGNKSVVKSHMQGISGVQCTVEEYNEIIELLKNKRFEYRTLPIIKGPQLFIEADLNNEKDIEIYLLEPLLRKLGYTDNDWVRQMPVRMGRGEKFYPDYAIKPNMKKGEETADFVWEAIYRMVNQKQLRDGFFQAKSYALRLNTNGLGLVSMEGIYLSYKHDGYYFDKIIKYSWDEINDPDIFNRLLLDIGRSKH